MEDNGCSIDTAQPSCQQSYNVVLCLLQLVTVPPLFFKAFGHWASRILGAELPSGVLLGLRRGFLRLAELWETGALQARWVD